MTTHCVIPDTQIRPGDDLEFLSCIGRFLVKKQPDVIIQIGDWADMDEKVLKGEDTWLTLTLLRLVWRHY